MNEMDEATIIKRLSALTRFYLGFVRSNTRLINQRKAIIRNLAKLREEGFPVNDISELELIEPFELAQIPIQAHRVHFGNEIEVMAKKLKVWPWVNGIRGAGPLNLGLIVGVARDLSNFPDFHKLWKWFGLAPGQRRIKGKKTDYDPQNRSIAFNVSESLMKQNKEYYRKVFEDRKAYLIPKHPEWALLKTKRRFDEDEEDQGKAKKAKWKYHDEALRYLAKRFLRDLWRAWRDCHADNSEATSDKTAIASSHQSAEQKSEQSSYDERPPLTL